MLATPPSTSCDMRSPASSEQRVRPTSLLCGRLLVALVESVLRPGGWENMCRLMCHCVRHVSLDNKYGRSVKRYTRHDHVGRLARSSVPAHTGRADGKKSSMGSENRQRRFRGNLKSSVTRSIAPKRVALENRRYLPERLLLPSSRYAQTEAQKGCEYSTSSATYAVKPGGN